MDLWWVLRGKAEHHAISLRKVSVLIAMYGAAVTYHKHLCSSQHFSSSKNDLKCTALYSSPSPDVQRVTLRQYCFFRLEQTQLFVTALLVFVEVIWLFS